MTPEQKAKLEIAIKEQSHKREVELLTLAAEQDEVVMSVTLRNG